MTNINMPHNKNKYKKGPIIININLSSIVYIIVIPVSDPKSTLFVKGFYLFLSYTTLPATRVYNILSFTFSVMMFIIIS